MPRRRSCSTVQCSCVVVGTSVLRGVLLTCYSVGLFQVVALLLGGTASASVAHGLVVRSLCLPRVISRSTDRAATALFSVSTSCSCRRPSDRHHATAILLTIASTNSVRTIKPRTRPTCEVTTVQRDRNSYTLLGLVAVLYRCGLLLQTRVMLW